MLRVIFAICRMFSLLALGIISPCLLIVALIYFFKLPKQPTERVKAFIERAKSGPLAHRGGRPENTLTAIKKSSELGASGVEVDLAFTKDGHPVLLHDSRIDRTSNGSGRVQDKTLEQLKKLEFGVKTGGPDMTGVRIPTLYEAVNTCVRLDLLMLLELKGNLQQSVQVVKKLFSENPSLYDRVAIISFYPNILYQVRKEDKNILVGLITRSSVLSWKLDGSPRNSQLWKHTLAVVMDWILTVSINSWLWRVLGISLIVINKNDILSKRMKPATWKQREISVITWTVNSRTEKNQFRYIYKLPFMTDYVGNDISFSEQE